MAKGLTGEIYIDNNCVVIAKKGLLAGIIGSVGGVKVPIKNITALDFKEPSFLTGRGYLQIIYPGATVSSKREDKVNDQNCVHFSSNQMPEFRALKEDIEAALFI